MALETWTEQRLIDLAWHWGSAFILTADPWTARPLFDQKIVLRADTAVELLEQMRACYFAHLDAKSREAPEGDQAKHSRLRLV